MNTAQRKLLVRSLFVISALCAAWLVFVLVVVSYKPEYEMKWERGLEAVWDDFLWVLGVAPVAAFAALYLRAGGKKE